MIDIRQEISKLFDQYSHNIIYVRRETKFRCTCYSERSGNATADCPLCFGTGYDISIETVRTRRNISSVPETLIGVNQNDQYGRVAPKAYVYYMEYYQNPSVDDLILEVIWDAHGVPRKIKEKYLISAVEPKFGLAGRTEFFQVYCRYDQKGEQDDYTLSKY